MLKSVSFRGGIRLRKGWLLLLFFVVALAGVLLPAAGANLDRLHPYLRAVLSWAERDATFGLERLAESVQVSNSQGIVLPPSFGIDVGGTVAPVGERIGVLVKTRRAEWGNTFLGLPVSVTTGTVLGLRVSLDELRLLAGSANVVYVEPAWRTEPKLDRSLPAIGVDLVHDRVPAVLGDGVIVGAVDTGIDTTHPDFRSDRDGDGFEESSRILYLWDQTAGFLGTYYTREEIESDLARGGAPGTGLVRETDVDGHGTHVMSVAAGDGSSSAAGLVGVAPEARLIVVKTPFYTSDILSGVSYIFDRAEALGLPAVVNLSLGGQSGPHDGTSLFEQGLDELAQGPGRAIVVSAGNEGDQAIHASQTLAGGSSSFSVQPRSDSFDLELWYPGGSRFTLTVLPPGGSPVVVLAGTWTSVPTSSGSVTVDNAAAGPNPLNGDRQILVSVTGVVAWGVWTFTVADAGGGGRFDGWITTSNGGEIVGGDTSHTIDEPGNARRVITVAAFNTKAHWSSVSGEQDFSSLYPIGGLSYFSSQGPTRDGRQKPDLAAPGAWVAAALSASSLPNDYLIVPDRKHTVLLGTSVSAPHVTGVAALLLSVNPDLTGEEVKARLVETARSDAATGAVPNALWGWGKVAADQAVQAVEPPPDGNGEGPKVTLAENPVESRALFVYQLPSGTLSAALRVYDIVGRLVFEAALDVGAGEYAWGLEDRLGEPLASGLYLYVVVADAERSAIGRLVIDR